MGEEKSEVLQGTLDLMVLKILETMGPLHGYGIARRIEQLSENSLSMNQGTVYPALVRLQQQKWIKADWGTTDKNRRAKFYSLTKLGERQLVAETQSWQRVVATIGRCLATSR
jgi:PadR family transcriptional regulator, regulatory protein PadR